MRPRDLSPNGPKEEKEKKGRLQQRRVLNISSSDRDYKLESDSKGSSLYYCSSDESDTEIDEYLDEEPRE